MDYVIQEIPFRGQRVYRVLQNVGGPCPLIGICNVLLLRNDIRVNKHVQTVNFKDLTACLRDHLAKYFESQIGKKANVNELELANGIKNIEDCIQLFDKLEEGLDINIKFSDVNAFEFTPQVAMFDAYDIRLYHGWILDPQDKYLFDLIGHKSYNEIVDFLTNDTYDNKLSENDIAKIEKDKNLIRDFLQKSQQQLTIYGLTRLHEVMNNEQLAILLHNNHFSCIYKLKGRIYMLVTDQGFIEADAQITWQTLTQLSGDEQFLTNDFNSINKVNLQQKQAEIKFLEEKNSHQEQQQQQQQQQQSIPPPIVNNNNNGDNNNNSNNINNNDNDVSLEKNEIKNESQTQIPLQQNQENDQHKNKSQQDTQLNDDPSLNDKFPNIILKEWAEMNDDEKRAYEKDLGLQPGEYDILQKEQQEAMKTIHNKDNNNNNNNTELLDEQLAQEIQQQEDLQLQQQRQQQQQQQQHSRYPAHNQSLPNQNTYTQTKNANKDKNVCIIM